MKRLLSIAVVALSIFFLPTTQSCSLMRDPVALDVSDSLALAEFLVANGVEWGAHGVSYEKDGLGKVTSLKVTGQLFTQFTSHITQLTELTELSITYSGVTSIPVDLDKLIWLKSLRLNNNEIALLPSYLRFENLNYVDLSNNKIIALPDTMDVTRVIELDLSNNHIVVIPEGFEWFTRLVRLDLSYNKINTLPAGVGKMVALNYADLSYNLISKLPVELMALRPDYINVASNYLCGPNVSSDPEQEDVFRGWLTEADLGWTTTQNCTLQ
ncbi:MAG: leucine-rich repeat domain-containing protein [Fibrobacterales bacterium]